MVIFSEISIGLSELRLASSAMKRHIPCQSPKDMAAPLLRSKIPRVDDSVVICLKFSLYVSLKWWNVFEPPVVDNIFSLFLTIVRDFFFFKFFLHFFYFFSHWLCELWWTSHFRWACIGVIHSWRLYCNLLPISKIFIWFVKSNWTGISIIGFDILH